MIHNPIKKFENTKERFLSGALDQNQYQEALAYFIEEAEIYQYSQAREFCIKEFITNDFKIDKSLFSLFENLLISDSNFIVRFNALFVLIKYFQERVQEPFNWLLENEDGFLLRLGNQLGIRNSKKLCKFVNNPVISLFLNYPKEYNKKRPFYNNNPELYYFQEPNLLRNSSGTIIFTFKKNKARDLIFKKKFSWTEFKKLKEETLPEVMSYYRELKGITIYEYNRKDNTFRYCLMKNDLYPHLTNIVNLFNEDYDKIKITLYTQKTDPAIFFKFPKSQLLFGIRCYKVKFWNEKLSQKIERIKREKQQKEDRINNIRRKYKNG